MPQYLAPGVYVEEVDTGIKTIEGVSTSVAGMVGATLRGPTRGLPQLVTSFAEFERIFGGYFGPNEGFSGHKFLPHAVSGFFTNGGRQLYVMRVAKDVSPARKETHGGAITRLDVAVNDATTTFKPVSTLAIQKGTVVQLQMVVGGVTHKSNTSTVQSVNRTTGLVTVATALTMSPTAPQYLKGTTVFTDANDSATLTTDPADPASVRDPSVTFHATDPGAWGRDIVIKTTPRPVAQAEVDTADDTKTTVTLKTKAPGIYTGAWLEIDRGDSKVFRKVKAVDNTGAATVLTIDGYTNTDFDPIPTTASVVVTVWELDLEISYGNVNEKFEGLTLENIPGKYILDRLSTSALVTVDGTTLPAIKSPLYFPTPDNGSDFKLDDAGFGDDGNVPLPDNYKGSLADEPGDRQGIKALEDIDRISIIAAPGRTEVDVQNVLIEQCERLKDRFAVLDPELPTNVQKIQSQRQQFDSKYAALYFPNLRVFDPVSGGEITVPPSGHMAGIYARVDSERGVHKAPANEVVRGIVDFSTTINKETQDLLNPSPTNINVFRDFRADGRGLRIWGARVITSDTSWKYINVRRLFLFIEESIDEGTQWVVFEPNDEPLWARVRQSISAFLTRVWRDGALQGATPEEAFFVKCDRSTMTQDDLDNGRLICIVGVAPVKPAEFVIIRISQFTASTNS